MLLKQTAEKMLTLQVEIEPTSTALFNYAIMVKRTSQAECQRFLLSTQ